MHDIVIQEKVRDASSENDNNVEYKEPRSKKRSIDYEQEVLEPCFIKVQVEPNLTVTSIVTTDTTATNKANYFDFI